MMDITCPSGSTQRSETGSQETRLRFTLGRWCLWQSAPHPKEEGVNSMASPRQRGLWPDGEVLPFSGGSADVGFLPMMQRRRLSPLARAASAVAWHCWQKCGDMPSVFFSSHGESQYYFEMLHGMMMGREEISPSRFSLCVHNAIAGLSSLHRASFLPYVSLAGGTEGIFGAFLEAAGQLLDAPKVLVVWYGQALPESYRAYLATPGVTWALAMVLARAGGPGHQLRLVRRPGNSQSAGEGDGQSLAQAILDGRRSSLCPLGRSLWLWSLDDA